MHAMTVDLEEYFCDYPDIFMPHTKKEDELASRLTFRTDEMVPKLLDIFAESNTKATFFVLGYLARHRPELIKRIFDAGHEIGIHGYGHQNLLNIKPDQLRTDLSRAINHIEGITGEKVLWYRAPDFSIKKENLWVFDILYEAGIRYDSSIFSAKRHCGGIPDFPNHPCVIRFNGGELIEFPVSPFKLGPFKLPFLGGGYFRLAPYPLVKLGINELDRQKIPCVFYIHPYDLDTRPTPIELPMSPLSRFRSRVRRQSTAKRLKQLSNDFHWEPLGRLAKRYSLPPKNESPAFVLKKNYNIFPIKNILN